jgi:DNA-binding NtrC family response regulator
MAKIMVADGFSAIRELLMEELASEGHIVTAVGEIKSIQERIPIIEPDLLIMDIYMNGKVSWTLLEEIIKHNPHLPALIFTGYGAEEALHSSLVDGFVVKSSDLDELKKKVKEILMRNYHPADKKGQSISV